MANNIKVEQVRAFVSKVKRALKPRKNAAGDKVALQWIGMSDVQPLLSFLRQQDGMNGVRVSRMPDDPMQVHYTSVESIIIACEKIIGKVPEQGVLDGSSRRGAMYRVIDEPVLDSPGLERPEPAPATPPTPPTPPAPPAPPAPPISPAQDEPNNVVLDPDEAVEGFAVVDNIGTPENEIPAPVELEALQMRAVDLGMSQAEAEVLDRDALETFLAGAV